MKYYKQCFVFLAAAMLSACSSHPPATPVVLETPGTGTALTEDEQQTLIDRCMGYLAEFRSGRFDHFYKNAGNILKTSLPQIQAQQEWSALAAQARTFHAVLAGQILQTEKGTEVQITSVHSRYNIMTTFVYRDMDTPIGLSFRLTPLSVAPQANERWEEIPITLGYDPDKQLNGMLTLPKNVPHPPVTILVPGSGPQGMDSLIGASDNRPFADLAHGLADNGIASIRYDKRSYVYPEDVVNIETEYLYDVQDAVRSALEEPRVDANRLYLIGHSQGGMLSPKLVLDNPELKGMVSLGGTLRRLEDVILEQHETMMAQDTTLTDEEKSGHISQIQEELLRIRGLGPDSPDDREEILLGYPVSYWISLNAVDSKQITGELTVPMLILQGDNDFQVLYQTDFKLWQEVLKGKNNVRFEHYEGLSHVFMPGRLEHFDSSSYDPPATMDSMVIEDIAGWIDSH